MEANNTNSSREPEKNLESAEYRASLLRKLNTLISVVEVALAKVRMNLQAPGADLERLTRIRLNLENTLNVCRRARLALERKEPMPAGLPGDLAALSLQKPGATEKKTEAKEIKSAPRPIPLDVNGMPKMTYRDYVEFKSVDEYHKFKKLNPIRPEDVKSTNIDELAKKFGGVDEKA